MSPLLTEEQLNEMAVFKAVAIDRIGAESVQYYKHILKLIIYGDSTGNLHHWAGEVAQCLFEVNAIIVKPAGKKLRSQDYLDCFLLRAGDTLIDYEDDLKFVQKDFETKYPQFTITPELSWRTYQTFLDLADYFAPILSFDNHHDKEWFRNKIIEYLRIVMTKNTSSTRFYSSMQEQAVAKAMGAFQQANSGAGAFAKGDVCSKSASMLFECKTTTSNKDSFSIKRDWLEKVEEERKSKRLDNSCVVINFGPDTPYNKNYYIINERLMKFLVDKLEEEHQ